MSLCECGGWKVKVDWYGSRFWYYVTPIYVPGVVMIVGYSGVEWDNYIQACGMQGKGSL